MLYRNSVQNGPTIEWAKIQENFERTKQDVLFMLDCCYAGSAVLSKGAGPTKELLAACGSEDEAFAGRYSFTWKFVEFFRKMLEEEPIFQVGWLYQSMITSSQHPLPLHVNLNKSMSSICLKSLAVSSKSEPKPAITYRKVTGASNFPNGNTNLAVSQPPSLEASSVASSTVALSILSGNMSERPTENTSPDPDFQYEVLFTVKLLANVLPDSRGWTWTFPDGQVDGLKSVKVRSVYPTKSTLLLVTMPIRHWVILKDNPAYRFIDFVKATDLLHSGKVIGLSNGKLPARIDSDKISAGSEWEAIIPEVRTAMQDFYRKTKLDKHIREKRPGSFQRITASLRLRTRPENDADPNFDKMAQYVVQQLVVRRDEQGNYKGVSYDLHVDEIEQAFEETKESLKETLKDSPMNVQLEETIDSKIGQLEDKVLTTLDPEKKSKTTDARTSPDLTKGGLRYPRHSFTRSTHFDISIPENTEDTNMYGAATVKAESPKMATRVDSGLGSRRPKMNHIWKRRSSTATVTVGEGATTGSRACSVPPTTSSPVIS